MKKELKRQVYAWLLLLVFLPIMGVAALHVHVENASFETTCDACVNHLAHGGHLISGAAGLHDCVLCQLMNVHFLRASFVLLISPLFFHHVSFVCHTSSVLGFKGNINVSRAPPSLMKMILSN